MINQFYKTKILLIAGFLGSGKTTLLKRILSWEADLSGTVVLVNEFGDVGIDGSLLNGLSSDVVELTSGCICCSMKAGLAITLKDIQKNFRPKRILLEATGVAEPEAVASVLEDDELRGWMELSKIVTVLDIRFWIGREKFGPFFMNQVEQANLILLNKVDAMEEEEISACLKEMHEAVPESQVIPTKFCKIDPEILWLDSRRKNPRLKILDFYELSDSDRADHKHTHLHGRSGGQHTEKGEGKGYVAFDFSKQGALNEELFQDFLQNLPWGLFRIKGPVQFPDRSVLLNFVAGQCNWESWEQESGTKLVFVGWDVDKQKLLDQLRSIAA